MCGAGRVYVVMVQTVTDGSVPVTLQRSWIIKYCWLLRSKLTDMFVVNIVCVAVIMKAVASTHETGHNTTSGNGDIGVPISYSTDTPVNSTDASMYRNRTDVDETIIANHTSDMTNSAGSKPPTEKDLLEFLFKDYDSNARPVRNASHTINVETSLLLVSIDDLNEREQILTTYAWFNMEWMDEYLTWDPAEWAGIKMMIVPSRMVWSPDVVIRNSAKTLRGEILDEDKVYRYIIMHFGRIKLWTAGSITTSCQVDMTYFPFDDQVCHIGVDSWIYPMHLLYMRNASDEVDLSLYQKSGEWTLLNTDVTTRIDTYVEPEAVYSYTVLKYNLYLRRKSTYYIYNIVAPSVIMSLLVLLIFLLPAESGEKVSLGITVLLSFTVFQLVIADSMPKTSDNISVIVIYLLCTMILTSISLLCSVAILSLHHREDDTPVPSWLLSLATTLSRPFSYAPASCRAIQKQPCDKDKRGTGNGIDNIACDLPEAIQMGSADVHENGADGSSVDSSKGQCKSESEALLKWRQVARVVDLVLLVVFLGLNLVTAIVLLGIYPLSKPKTGN